MSLFAKGIADPEDLEHYDRSLSKEAYRVCEDIKFGVQLAEVSNQLDNNEAIAYINLRTLEKREFCVEITASGYRIVSEKLDTVEPEFIQGKNDEEICFETYESLMHKISPLFVQKFNDSVAARLSALQ
jgi:hypothetical protein